MNYRISKFGRVWWENYNLRVDGFEFVNSQGHPEEPPYDEVIDAIIDALRTWQMKSKREMAIAVLESKLAMLQRELQTYREDGIV